MERDDKRILIDGGLCDFNSHAHVERDYCIGKFNTARFDFNSHAHVERDARRLNVNASTCKFQLTRSRGA